MNFNWDNYLDLAKELFLTSSSDEAKLRSSISRAYYAAFNRARKYLKVQHYQVPRDYTAHEYVINQFRNSQKEDNKYWKDWRMIGSDLADLRERRNRADYDDILVNLPKKADFALKASQKIIDRLDKLLEEST